MNQSERLNIFFDELKKQTGDLRTDPYNRLLYSTDASIYQLMPYGVLLPRTAEEVQAAVELAAQYQIPVLPRTAGSSLAGQAVNEALVIDMSRHLGRVLKVNPGERWVRVEPGVVLDELNLYLKPYGLQFGPDPASGNRAAMGGIVSNNSTGAHSILYGMTADHVLECKGFLSDGSPFHFRPLSENLLAEHRKHPGLEGEIYQGIAAIAEHHADVIRAGTPRYWRRCGGYNLDRFIKNGISYQYPHDQRFNLAKLICGAEGTLAVMTEIKLNLVPLPRKTALALVQFDTLHEALSAVPAMLEVNPSAIELLDNLGLTMCRGVPEYARLLETFMIANPNCILITEFYGESETELKEKIRQLEDHLKRNKIKCSQVTALDSTLQQNVWTVRKVGLGLLMSIKGDYKPVPFIEDAAVPPEHLAEYISRVEKFCNDLGTKVAYYAHAGAGCLHVRPLINAKTAADLEKLPRIAQFSMELVGQYHGALSSEHGDGRARSWLNEQFYGKDLYNLYRQVKQIFDPQNILNPGNIVELHPMTENLRYGADYQVAPLKEHLDFRDDRGFHRAIEMCNGAAVCRKRTTGTMCPSFMVTREEEHSTRGRANALRAAISGRLPLKELTGKRMYELMDLCIECKACKAECPSSVDMAKIKFEFLAHYYEANSIPLRTRIFGDIAAISRIASGFWASLISWKVGNIISRKLLHHLLNISEYRVLPKFASEPFTAWFKKNRLNKFIDLSKNKVVLFNDTFNTYNDPHVAIAALEVLEAAGYQVLLPGHKCCGRPMISKGLLKKARRAAEDTLEKLAPFAQEGIPIVGLEPSCLLSFRDDYRYLVPDDPRVELVAKNSFTFEEFIADAADLNTFEHIFKPHGGRVLLHGHCHQKALVGTNSAKKSLEMAGYKVTVVDSGCCGMAGSFGYEREHYDISLAMAERRLLPAVREAAEDTLIVAAGTSCRHQILHGCGRRALHPAEALRKMLV
jgi:FAD/FMN-containing dehydrogenase/Fe-S oxidoreductase